MQENMGISPETKCIKILQYYTINRHKQVSTVFWGHLAFRKIYVMMATNCRNMLQMTTEYIR